MARTRHKRTNRDGSRFLAIPHTVLDSPAFLKLSAPAVRLLLDIARQYSGANNGQLVACMSYLSKRGWTSNDTVTRARRELEAAGFLIQTRMGARPNRAAWFAATWWSIDWMPAMDIARTGFERGLYRKSDPVPPLKSQPLRVVCVKLCKLVIG
jgi:hypothetical protein